MMSPTTPRTLSPEWRLTVLEVLIDQIRAECRAEIASNYPGARYRVAQLLIVGARLAGQIERAES